MSKFVPKVTNGGYTGKIVDENGNTVAIVGNYDQALIMASAPELLGALKELTERYKKVMGVSSDGWVNMANQVIAKAEGKERSIYCQLDENSYCTHCSGHEHLCRQAIAKAEGAL